MTKPPRTTSVGSSDRKMTSGQKSGDNYVPARVPRGGKMAETWGPGDGVSGSSTLTPQLFHESKAPLKTTSLLRMVMFVECC